MQSPVAVRPGYFLIAVLITLHTAFAQVEPSVRLAPEPVYDPEALEVFEAELAGAIASQPFSVDLVFEAPIPLGQLHDIAVDTGVTRVLGNVYYRRPDAPDHPYSTSVALGSIYASDEAWLFSECRARLYLSAGRVNSLTAIPYDEWPVDSAYVHGSADALRRFLEAVPTTPHPTEGRASHPRSLEVLARHAEKEMAAPIKFPANMQVIEKCQALVSPPPAPVLVAGYDEASASFIAAPGVDQGVFMLNHLNTLEDTDVVTMTFRTSRALQVRDLAELVTQYELDGLSASLSPNGDGSRVMSGVGLSVHGGPIADQVRFFECVLNQNSTPPNSGPWIATGFSISDTVATAKALINIPGLVEIRIDGKFAPQDLDRVVEYHQAAAEQRSAPGAENPFSPCRQ